MRNPRLNQITPFLLTTLCLLAACLTATAAPPYRFDVVTLCNCPIEKHLDQPQFEALNWPGAKNHYLAMGSDAHRSQILAQGNQLAVYYNFFNDGEKMTAAEKAATIEHYAQTGFTHSGARPSWVILNEISAGRWPVDAAYRKWVADVVSILKNKDNFSVVLCAPFQRPGAHPEDWQLVAANAYIGIECYLSGKAVKDHAFSPDWCEAQYRTSKKKYMRLGVPPDRLFLVEDFANTENAADKVWGRQGVSAEDWNRAIAVRSAASHKVGFDGFISYGWSGDRMKASDSDLIHFENTYRAQVLP